MNKPEERVEVAIEELKESSPAPDGDGVVLHTDAVVNGKLRDTTIEVSEADAPAVAVALLNGEAPEGVTPGLPEAVRCLAIGVVHSASAEQVRLHLQLETGQVMPIELSLDAAAALHRGLDQHIAAR
ncbi:MAG: hypothetical protein V4792_01650 [Pseudomonadota bacterium]